MIAGLTKAPIERTEQPEGFVEYSPDYVRLSQSTIVPSCQQRTVFQLAEIPKN